MARIFPINLKIKSTTWNNYSNYLNWLDRDIYSLEDYLTYFNPDFKILNEKLSAIQSNNWEQVDINPPENQKDPFENFEIGSRIAKICFPNSLDYREGIFNPYFEAYAQIKGKETITSVLSETKLNNLLADQTLIKLEPSQIIFAKKWLHSGLQSENNSLTQTPEHYLIMSQPQAALYLPQNVQNGLQFTYIENGQTILGTNLLFNLELSPSRYFITNENQKKWLPGGIQWSLSGAYWTSAADTSPTIQIQNAAGQVWTNSYPLMHEIYLTTENADKSTTYEDFIFDNEFETKEVNIANHNTVLYNINAKNITSAETNTNLWGNLIVSVI